MAARQMAQKTFDAKTVMDFPPMTVGEGNLVHVFRRPCSYDR